MTAKSQQVKVANSFGLPSGKAFSCPGATSACESVCYAGRLEKAYKGVTNVVMHNWNLLKDTDYETTSTLLHDMIWDFAQECDKYEVPKVFRIHWDGDFFSKEYAEAWTETCIDWPNVKFWVYTRSFTPDLNVVPILANVPNLSMYLSIDADNAEFAPKVLEDYPQVRVATLAQTAVEAQQMFPERTVIPCPENIKKIPLIVKDKGACVACGLCIRGKHDVAFSIGKKLE